MIVNAIATAKAEYWSRLYDWLESTLPAVNEVILSGGAALYLEQELQDCFQEISTYWGLIYSSRYKKYSRIKVMIIAILSESRKLCRLG